MTFTRINGKSTERFQSLRRELGITSFGINALTLQPGEAGRIHRHREQEEVYVVLDGVLTISVEGDERRMEQGECVRIAPSVRRQLINREQTPLVLLALGAAGEHIGRDGEAFASWEDTEPQQPKDIPLPARTNNSV